MKWLVLTRAVAAGSLDQRIVTAATKKQKAEIAARNVSSRSHLLINARHSVGGEAAFQLRTASLMGTPN